MSDWLDLELADQLAPVRAPHDLWVRVNQARGEAESRRQPARRVSTAMAFWPVAAALVAGTIAAWTLVERRAPVDFEQMALADLQGSEVASLQSGDAVEVSSWLARNTGIDVNVPRTQAAEISGARIVERGGVKAGEIFYKVKGTRAALLVAKPDRGAAVKAVQGHGHRTWESRGVTYALACAAPESDHLECLLCHTAAL